MNGDETDLAWETLDSETEYTCPGFDVVRDDVVLPGGERGSFHYVTDAPSVIVLPFTADGDDRPREEVAIEGVTIDE